MKVSWLLCFVLSSFQYLELAHLYIQFRMWWMEESEFVRVCDKKIQTEVESFKQAPSEIREYAKANTIVFSSH